MVSIPHALARSVFDDAAEAMLIVDSFGTIWFANRKASALFGHVHDEIIGENIDKLVPERFRSQHTGREQFLSNVRVRPLGAGLDLHGLRRDGTEFPIEITLTPLEDVGRTLIAAAIRDATDRKRVEAELAAARGAIEAMRELADGAIESLSQQKEAIAAVSRLLAALCNVERPKSGAANAQVFDVVNPSSQ